MNWIELLGAVGVGTLLASVINGFSARRNLVYSGRSQRRDELCTEMLTVGRRVQDGATKCLQSPEKEEKIALIKALGEDSAMFDSLILEGEYLLSHRSLRLSRELSSAASVFVNRYGLIDTSIGAEIGFRFSTEQILARSLIQEKTRGIPVVWWRRLVTVSRRFLWNAAEGWGDKDSGTALISLNAELPTVTAYLKKALARKLIQKVQAFGVDEDKTAFVWLPYEKGRRLQQKPLSLLGRLRESSRRKKVNRGLHRALHQARGRNEDTSSIERATEEMNRLGWVEKPGTEA